MSHRTVLPPATIGMMGGGQLGRYALVAARQMGYRTVVVDPDPSAPAGAVADDHLVTAYDDPATLQRLALDCDVVTTEFENPPAAALDHLADRGVIVAPTPAAVRIAQDRIAEKAFLAENGFPIGPYAVLDTVADRGDADIVEGGAVLKTARLGYDGKGQRRVSDLPGLHAAWAELGGVPCVVESLLDFEAELSVVVARTADGRSDSWPVAENRHVDGILDLSVVPAPIDAALADRAVGLALAIADALAYVGVLAVEMFVVDGELLVNELAPRPHNSGHWTLDASMTSQYEQQIRAVCGLGLGRTTMTADSIAMVNLLGDVWSAGEPAWETVLDEPRAKLHLYGKHQPKPGRKMGHLTVTSEVASEAIERALALRAALTRPHWPRPH
ncbi:MAG: 5-(carboxyamino)imidazole ribonucleotide synthase [Ilumatobacteraceae bacterium]